MNEIAVHAAYNWLKENSPENNQVRCFANPFALIAHHHSIIIRVLSQNDTAKPETERKKNGEESKFDPTTAKPMSPTQTTITIHLKLLPNAFYKRENVNGTEACASFGHESLLSVAFQKVESSCLLSRQKFIFGVVQKVQHLVRYLSWK